VITGFASICVNGLEVRYDNSASVDIGGVPALPALLRAGQVVAVQAHGSQSAPVASAISVRQDVVGRIETVEPGTGRLTIAGQLVAVGANTRGAAGIRLGDWVAVSGLWNANGTLVASRIDAAKPGGFNVHGQVVLDGGLARVGGLTLTGTAASGLTSGQFVAVSGHYESGEALVVAVAVDSLASDPASYFGPGVKHLVLESFVRVSNGSVWLNGRQMKAAPGVGGKAETGGIAIVSLDRKADGEFTVVRVRYTVQGGFGIGNPGTSSNAVDSGPPQTPLQIWHGNGPVPATSTDDIEPEWMGTPVSELPMPDGSSGGGMPPSLAGDGVAEAIVADAQKMESVSPAPGCLASDLIVRTAAYGNDAAVPAAGSGSSGRTRHADLAGRTRHADMAGRTRPADMAGRARVADLVGGSSFSSAASLSGNLPELDTPAVEPSPGGAGPAPKADATGTSSNRSSSSGTPKQTDH
jgi:hypothetical protein